MQLILKLNSIKKIEKDHGLDSKGNKFLREKVDAFCDPYVPWSGNGSGMKGHKTYPSDNEIKYISPYAHYMYKGVLMVGPDGNSWAKKGQKKHYTGKSLKFSGAPKRGANWDKRMMNDRKKDLIKDLQNYVKNGGK